MFLILIYFVDYMRARVLSFIDRGKMLRIKDIMRYNLFMLSDPEACLVEDLAKVQKFLYLPYPHNDFIFSVIAEELGFIGVLTIMILFLIFTLRGIKVAMNAPDLFGSLTAIGITSLITVQTVLNIAVATSSVPPTGVSLPF